MNTKNEKAVVADKELEKVSGGEITVNDFSAEMTCKASAGKETESTSFKVGFFPGLSGFP